MSAAARVLKALSPVSGGRLVARTVPATPPTVVRADGGYVWDADGVRRHDFHNRDGVVILGHADPLVAAAAADPDPRSAAEAAERLRAFTPGAETVAFMPSAQAAMLAALRMARAATGRERVVVLSNRPMAGHAGALIAADAAAASDMIATYGADLAALVVAPLALAAGDLVRLATAARSQGAVLVFDEHRSGLRVHEGGAQALLGVRADLAVEGSTIGNGAQIAAVTGRKDLVAAAPVQAAPTAQALAAAAATLRRIAAAPVVASLRIRGAELEAEVEALLVSHGAAGRIEIVGDPSWSRLTFASRELRAAFLAAALEAGIYTTGEHVMSYAHGDEAISALVRAYEAILPRVLGR
jgi:glutamate-1-semialdehyde 2,1-aminomutase